MGLVKLMVGTVMPREGEIPPLHGQILRTAGNFDLNEFGRILFRRKAIILSTVAAAMLSTQLWLIQTTSEYTASSYVMLQPRESRVVDVEAVLSGLPTDTAGMQSEIQVLMSRKLAFRTVAELDLVENPEFNSNLRPKSAWRAVLNPKSYIPDSWLELFRDDAEKTQPTKEELEARERAQVVNQFLSRLDIAPEGRSHVIKVAFSSADPRLAAEIANTHADFYIVSQLEAKFEATKRATQWLSERLMDLRQEVVVAEGAVEEYRKSMGLIKGESADLAAEEVSELNTLLVQARTRRAEADARLRQMRKLLDSPEGIESAAEVLG
ncbi:MAG: GumC family protein, partial [Rhodospirillales bacterium]|nr:GumC family protein [Rhodospirillales bacterium]